MGVFAEYQPLYASHNIPTFPMQGKTPAVKGFARIGCKASEQLAFKFPEIDALAFVAGARARLTVLDIDSPDEDLLRDMLKRHGQTPIIVRSGSGNFQAWYRFGGEKREIRPYGAAVPVDLLGGGVVVAPPSKGSKGEYQFTRGSLDDLHKLRPADNVIQGPWAKPDLAQPVAPRELIGAGGRNKALMDHLRGQARFCDTLDDLLDVARHFANERIDRIGGHPFEDAEIVNTAKSVWNWVQRKIAEGQYFPGTGQRLILAFDAIDKVLPLGPDAVMLYVTLQRRSNHRSELIVANAMADEMPDGAWNRKRFAKARAALVGAGILAEGKTASTWTGPTRYFWT